MCEDIFAPGDIKILVDFCDLFLIRKNKLPQAEISHFLSSETWVRVALLSDLWAVGLIEMQGNILNK